jgi:hypothetical protein
MIPDRLVLLATLVVVGVAASSLAQRAGPPACASLEFVQQMRRMEAARAGIIKKTSDLLAPRYDLSGRTDPAVGMSGGRKAIPIPVGPTARLSAGVNWDALAALSPGEIKRKNLFPYLPLPHPLEPDGGGMVFPRRRSRRIPS